MNIKIISLELSFIKTVWHSTLRYKDFQVLRCIKHQYSDQHCHLPMSTSIYCVKQKRQGGRNPTTGIRLDMGSTNKRRYIMTPPLIGGSHKSFTPASAFAHTGRWNREVNVVRHFPDAVMCTNATKTKRHAPDKMLILEFVNSLRPSDAYMRQ